MAVILDDLRSAGVSTAHRPVVEEAASDLHKTAAGTLSDAESHLLGQGCCRPELHSFIHSFIHSFSSHLLSVCRAPIERETQRIKFWPLWECNAPVGGDQSQTKKERNVIAERVLRRAVRPHARLQGPGARHTWSPRGGSGQAPRDDPWQMI